MPVLDARRRAVLARQIGNNAADEFLRGYLRLLPERINRVAAAIAWMDLDGAMDAVLSLKVTSSMIGAVRLELFCQGLQSQLSAGHFMRTETARAVLSAHAALVLHEVLAGSACGTGTVSPQTGTPG